VEEALMRSRRTGGLAAVVTAALALTATGTAGADEPGPKGQPAPAYQPATGPACHQHAAASKVRDEWLSCLGVSAALDRAPSVGETATLSVTVGADAVLPSTDVRVELPAGLAWAQPPAGFAVTQQLSALPERAGTLSVARLTAAMRPGAAASYTGVVRAVRPGPAQIQVRATAKDGAEVRAGADNVFLTVAPTGVRSRLDQAAKDGAAPVAAVPTTQRVPRQAGLVPRSAGTEGLPKGRQTNAPCDTRVTGNWSYSDQNGAWHNSMNFQVQVRDKDANGTDDTLAVGLTDGAGNYNICFDSNSDAGEEGGTADVYLTFVSEVAQWRVQRGGGALNFSTGVTQDVVPGSTTNFGSLTSGDGTLMRGIHAFDEANDAWLWIPKPVNGCFDQNDATCRQLRINWAPDSTDGTYYSTGGNDVHLAADDPNAAITVVHEIGHAVMDDVFNDAFPAAPSCNPHSIQGATSTGCAWTEGWAEWFPATVYNDPNFRWPNGAVLNLENASWGNGWGEGDSTEGRIAGALIDITDVANEPSWDRYGEGSANLWFTFTHHVSNTLAQFWSNRGADGFDVSDAGALADLFQNTVDYGFRDPLGNYTPLTRPTPRPAHNFGFGTSTVYWSVVAVRPPAGNDYDLQLYDDRGQTAALPGSAFGGSTVDFVAIDSNLRALGDYYPRAFLFSGAGGDYGIELAQGAQTLPAGASTITMGAAEVVAVRDLFLTAGTPVTLTVAPTNAGQDPELFLMGDDPANAATFVRPRSTALASSSGAGAGAAEQLTFTPTVSGWYGAVVVNKAGSGNYTVTRA
jgi:hypothetical protein